MSAKSVYIALTITSLFESVRFGAILDMSVCVILLGICAYAHRQILLTHTCAPSLIDMRFRVRVYSWARDVLMRVNAVIV